MANSATVAERAIVSHPILTDNHGVFNMHRVQIPFLSSHIKLIISGINLPGRQREILRIMLERCAEDICSPCFNATVPQVYSWVENAGIPSSVDTVQRAFSSLQAMGIAILQNAARKGGHQRRAAVWAIDFRLIISSDLSTVIFPQNAAVHKSNTVDDLCNNITSQVAGCRTDSPREARSPSEEITLKWQGCLDILTATGEKVHLSAVRQFTASGRTPEATASMLSWALQKGRLAQSQGKRVNLVAYALSAIAPGGWGDDFIKEHASTHQSNTSNSETTQVHEWAIDREWAETENQFRTDRNIQEAWTKWAAIKKHLQGIGSDHPAFLEQHDAERKAFQTVLLLAEQKLGAREEALRAELRLQLHSSGVMEDTPVWRLAWAHRWAHAVWTELGLPGAP